MIKTEFLRVDESVLIRHFSDIGMKIRQLETGVIYDDAIDVVPCRYTYEETDTPIDIIPQEEEAVWQ